MKSIAIIFILIFGVCVSEKARFDFYRVYEVSIDQEIHLELLRQIDEFPDGYKFFASLPKTIGKKASIIVPPHKFGEWSELIEKYSMDVRIVSNNLQQDLDRAEANQMRRKALDWNRFWRLEEIYDWFQTLIDARPNDLSWFNAGTSYEGREIKGLKINVGKIVGKCSIFYEATIHGWEWLGATSTTYIINELLNDPSMASLLERFEWYFLPVFNVDGFAYAWDVDRMWRKNRKPSTRSLLCMGTDPNRNFDINWNVSAVSTNPCHSRYPGDFAFSEPETKQFSEFIQTVPNLDIYLTFHQYGQFFMIPTGHSETPINNYQLHYEIAEISNELIFNTTGTVYELGTIGGLLGLISGISSDWILENFPPKLTFGWELRPTWEIGESGIWSSPTLIEPTARDMYVGSISVINEAIKRGIV